MSCYICDKETLETVLKAWLMCNYISIRAQEDLDKAWYEILSANYQAVSDRYGDNPIPPDGAMKCPLTMEDWFFTSPEDKPSNAERYSALKKYMYQCSEGDYHNRRGYYKSQWCLDAMLEDYLCAEFPEATGWGFYKNKIETED